MAEGYNVKKIYVGNNLVWPKFTPVTYTYDFDDWTWTRAKLLADWWQDRGSWQWLTWTTSWLAFYNTATDVSWNMLKKITVTWWEKVTLYFKWVKSWSWWGVYGSVASESNWNYDSFIYLWSTFNNYARRAWVGSTVVQSLGYQTSIEWTISYNRVTWAYTSTIDWTTVSGSVTPFDISDNLGLYVSLSKGYYQLPSYIYKYHVTFE